MGCGVWAMPPLLERVTDRLARYEITASRLIRAGRMTAEHPRNVTQSTCSRAPTLLTSARRLEPAGKGGGCLQGGRVRLAVGTPATQHCSVHQTRLQLLGGVPELSLSQASPNSNQGSLQSPSCCAELDYRVRLLSGRACGRDTVAAI